MRKKILAALLLAAALVVAPSAGLPAATVIAAEDSQQAVGLGVAYHTQQEILDRMKKDGLNTSDTVSQSEGMTYGETPVTTAPYAAGSLSQDTLNKALAMLNQIRYIAGLQDNVTLSDEYNGLTQAAALVNYVNRDLSHEPAQPADMAKELYDLGYRGASKSNIASASWQNRSLNGTILHAWMADWDDYNIARVGHRRWVLNPQMGATGFGAVSGENGTYNAMYAIDYTGSGQEYGVAWPAQNMPVSYFDKFYPWSVSMGSDVDESTVKVTLTRVADGRTWTFGADSADGVFAVNNNISNICGQTGCIVFRPDGIEDYKAGDSFRVTIEGLASPVSYTVNFFDESSVNGGSQDGENPGGSDQQPGGENPGGSDQQPGGENPGGSDQQPGGENPGGSDQQPGGENPGGSTNQPDSNPGGGTTQPGSQGGQSGSNVPAANVVVNVDWNAVGGKVDEAAMGEGVQNAEVHAGDEFEVPASVMNGLKGKDVTLMLHTGKGISFSIAGQDVKKQDGGWKVTMLSSVDIPAAAEQTVLQGAEASVEFGTQENETYAVPVGVHLNLGKENAGKRAFLYVYDEASDAMKLVSSFTVTAEGGAMFGMSRGGRYIAVVSEKAAEVAGMPTGRNSYTVKPGDTLSRIAAGNGISLGELMKANPQIKNKNVIKPGQVIQLR